MSKDQPDTFSSLPTLSTRLDEFGNAYHAILNNNKNPNYYPTNDLQIQVRKMMEWIEAHYISKDQPLDELTFEQCLEIDEYLENYKNNPSNSNKYRIGLHAHINELLQAECNRARIEWADEFLQWYMGGRIDSDFFTDKNVVFELIETISELQQLMKEGE